MLGGEGPLYREPIIPLRVYTLAEVVEMLNISDSTARRWLSNGQLRGAKLGKEWRFLGSHLIDALQSALKERKRR